MKYANGDCYTGEWNDRFRQGQGKTVYSDGRVEEGQWIDDRLYKGEIINYPDGGRYEGSIQEDGKRHGHGEMRYANGDVYIGNFKNDLRCTLGTLATFKLQSGCQYIGAWKDD